MTLQGSSTYPAAAANMPSLGLFAYPSKDIAVTPDNVQLILRGCGRELGLSIPYELPKIDLRRRVLLEHFGCGAGYDPKTKSLCIPRQQDEAIIFHELVHYLMHQEGLLLQDNPFLVGHFYQRLVNETLAEAATFNVFGYEEQTSFFPQSVLVGQQRALASGYLQGTPQREWNNNLLKLEQMLVEAKSSGSDLDIGVRLIAIESALRLHEKQVTSAQLVERVRAAKARYSSPTEIYYYGLVEALL